MVMGKPSWMTSKCYPAFSKWPRAEAYFPTRYVWAHSEFTPQQTMRGKTALYGYLYGIGGHRIPVRRDGGGEGRAGRKMVQLTIGSGVVLVPAGENRSIRLLDLSGRVLWSGVRTIASHARLPLSIAGANKVGVIEVSDGGRTTLQNRVLMMR
jgi:hypothetical protein